jgi:plastocyanin
MRYKIRGHVVDVATGNPIGGVRVEAWDKDFFLDDHLATASTISDGSFTVEFDDSTFREFFDRFPDVFFRVYCYNQLLASTEDSVLWNIREPAAAVEIEAILPDPPAAVERHVYLKIERIADYSTVKPQEKGGSYGRDCMRNHGHMDGTIPQAEIDARSLDAVVYREYLDSGYLVPKPNKLIAADINEPTYTHRVPGTVIYTRPGEILKVHVWNTDDVPHSFHTHGLRYGIDSDGAWPFGTVSSDGLRRSDAICPGDTWTYTFEVPSDAIGIWPFHDHTHPGDNKIEQGLFGGFVVLGPCDRPPRRFRFPWDVVLPIYLDVARLEGRAVLPERQLREDPELDDDATISLEPHVHLKHLKKGTRQVVAHHLDFLEEFAMMSLALPPLFVNTDHVPAFFHVMSNPDADPVFDTGDIEEFGGQAEVVFDAAGDFEYFCTHHPDMTGVVHVVPGGPALVTVTIVPGPAFSPADVNVGIAGTIRWINDDGTHHTATSRSGAAISTHCINGRGFVGNSPTIVGRSGQRIRWYVFNLDTGLNWHNFHPHAMRWKFGGEALDIRSMGPAESFVVEAEIPPVLLLTPEEEASQDPDDRPPGATLRHLKGDYVFHCHVHHHMMNGMIGLVRARQSVWLTDAMAEAIEERVGALPIDDGTNDCPDVEPRPCRSRAGGRWENVVGTPEVLFMHSVLLPGSDRVLFWGRTRADQSRVWDYSTPAGAYMAPANQPADLPGMNATSSNLWSAEHTILDTPKGLVLAHGGFTPRRSFTFDPGPLMWAQVGDTADARFYSTTLGLGNGRAATLYGSASKSIEVYEHGVGWSAPITMPASMNHHVYYPWTYLLPDGRLFIAGPHVPTHRFDLAAPGGAEAFPTVHGERSTGGEKGSSVMLILRPPDYRPMVMVIGGNPPAARKTAEIIDLSDPSPAWSPLPDLNVERMQQFTATLLPDGRVFIAGGITGGADGGPCEIYDPANPGGGWALGPSMKQTRTYHSSFILLRDGSVLGGGAPPDADPPAVYTQHERFFPEYFDAARPQIDNAPPEIHYGGSFNVDTADPSSILEVVLLRAGAVTHGFNMSQRGIELVITGTAGGSVVVDEPPVADLAPPGWYLLYILDTNRVPSPGVWVRVTP